jgi:hypothetical protein
MKYGKKSKSRNRVRIQLKTGVARHWQKKKSKQGWKIKERPLSFNGEVRSTRTREPGGPTPNIFAVWRVGTAHVGKCHHHLPNPNTCWLICPWESNKGELTYCSASQEFNPPCLLIVELTYYSRLWHLAECPLCTTVVPKHPNVMKDTSLEKKATSFRGA